MVVEPWRFDVIVRGRITAVCHIGRETIMPRVVPPPPPPAVWCQDDRVESVGSLYYIGYISVYYCYMAIRYSYSYMIKF